MTHKQLSQAYNCSSKTFTRWVKRLNVPSINKHNHTYNPAQLKIIFDKLGKPDGMDEDKTV